MRFRMGKRDNGGFTMIEMLSVAAIILILVTLGFAEVARNKRLLTLTELDNMAREIYLAAEGRAELLANSGRLKTLVEALNSLGTDKYYIKHNPDDDLGDLLPKNEGLIDPKLCEGVFYIVYDVAAECVTDVFYAESEVDFTGDAEVEGAFAKCDGAADFKAFYNKWATYVSRASRESKKINIGYYGGEMEAPAPPKPLTLKITIENGEELKLSVESSEVMKFTDLTGTIYPLPEVTLTYGAYKAKLDSSVVIPEPDDINNPTKYTWTLDTLTEGGQQFKKLPWTKDDVLVPDTSVIPFGGDFTAKASLEMTGYVTATASSRPENSLFAGISVFGGEVYIENLRHLQNLDKNFSGVGDDKTEACQRADIDVDASKFIEKDADGNVINRYKFQPVLNTNLKKYKSNGTGTAGEYYCIKNLEVTAGSTGTKPGAGLFAEAGKAATDDTPAVLFTFENVRMVNALVNGIATDPADNKPAGGLVGKAENVTFTNCHVTESDVKGSLQAGGMAGTAVDATFKNCRVDKSKVNGGNQPSGGMAGTATGSVAFTNCRVTNSEVNGSSSVGGMAGTAQNATFTKCWVYWEKTSNGAEPPVYDYYALKNAAGYNINYKIRGTNAGGLVGGLTGGTITSSLAATTVNGTADTGGLIGKSSGVVTIKKSYADCYLKGPGAAAGSEPLWYIGGLIGQAAGSVNITFSYTAGFAEGAAGKEATAGGLVGMNVEGVVTGNNVYAAVYYNKSTVTEARPLAKGLDPGSDTSAGIQRWFLRYDCNWAGSSDMMDVNKQVTENFAEFAKKLNNSAAGGPFDIAQKNTATAGTNEAKKSNPYNLSHSDRTGDGDLTNYPYPGLVGLPHYGDWTKKPEIPSKTPLAYVEIINGEELEVRVTRGAFTGRLPDDMKLEVRLVYYDIGGAEKTAIFEGDVPEFRGEDWETHTWSRVLDTLATSTDGDTRYDATKHQFKDWWTGTSLESFGRDFTVEARFVTAGMGETDGWGNIDKTGMEVRSNSLFAYARKVGLNGVEVEKIKRNDDGTIDMEADGRIKTEFETIYGQVFDADDVYILNLRHLQNLDYLFSRVKGKKKAYQIADIDAGKSKKIDGTILKNAYEFWPIGYDDKEDVIDYEALSGYSIKNLKVTYGSAKNHWGAGLFSSSEGATFTNIRLIDANVSPLPDLPDLLDLKDPDGTDFLYVGGLLGRGGDCKFKNCTLEQQSSPSVIIGRQYTGGLAGYLYGTGTSFEGCIVSGNVKVLGEKNEDEYGNALGGNAAGGLLGYAWGAVKYNNCRVDGITVNATSYSGGIVGISHNSIDKIEFKTCYIGQNSKVTIKGIYAGGIAGSAQSLWTEEKDNNGVKEVIIRGNGDITVEKCHIVNADVRSVSAANGYAGGLIGSAVNASFDGCKVGNSGSLSISGGQYSGGMVGYLSNTNEKELRVFKQCTVKNVKIDTSPVSWSSAYIGNVGGLVGSALGKQYTGAAVAGVTPRVNISFNGCNATSVYIKNTGYQANDDFTGGLAGNVSRTDFISSDAVEVILEGGGEGSVTGGIAGSAQDTTFSRCNATDVAVDGGGNAGGLVGGAQDTTFSECKALKTKESITVASETGDKTGDVKVKGAILAGGLVGFAGNTAEPSGSSNTFEKCRAENIKVYSDASGISGKMVTSSAGGLAGGTNKVRFSECTVNGVVVDGKKNASAGSLAGYATWTKFNGCQANGAIVTSDNTAGGLVGSVAGAVFSGDDVNTVSVTGITNVGGLVGFAHNVITEKVNGVETNTPAPCEFSDCEAVNATVKGNANVGGLVGSAVAATFDKCWVYWTTAASLKDNSVIKYKVTGTTVGGLIGAVVGGGTITNSFAATSVQGNGTVNTVGGLVGELQKLEGNSNTYTVTVQNSYADCYLYGITVGGLIGVNVVADKNDKKPIETPISANLSMKNVYAAGFIAGTGTTDKDGNQLSTGVGLCGGKSTYMAIENAYSAMYYDGNIGNRTYLVDSSNAGARTKYYWLDYDNKGGASDTTRKTYDEMKAATILAPVSDAFKADSAFITGTGDYPFPVLKMTDGNPLPRYGDWKTK